MPIARLVLLVVLLPTATVAQVDFARDVRPLLSDRCFRCHGPDEAGRKAGLRLDRREGAIAQRDGGAAIVPGDPRASLLLQRVRHADDGERMPPPRTGLSLSGEEIALLEAWITEGAQYDEHWSFRPPRRPPVPEVSGVEHPVDAFVRARLVDRGMAPAPETDRATLLRRLSFDLTGLPPTLAEIDAFERDAAPGAYERVVERLLARPAFGERMASDWLDLARYADTYGYQNDRMRRVWPWRDWVVRAFNDNLSLDDFLTWQLAGDMLPDATDDQRLATTFGRLHRQTNEGGSVEEEMRLEYVADRAQTVATAFMGLTLECARCHDHKFDPIAQRDYYRFTAFFDNIDESGLYSHFTDAVPTPAMSLATPEVRAAIDAQRAVVAAAERGLDALAEERRPAYERWLRGRPERLGVPGLRGSYTLDAVDKGKAANAVAKGRPATVAAATRVVPGRAGKALELTGDDAVKLPGVGAFGRHDPFTIALWLRAPADPEVLERAVVLHRSRAWTDAASQGYELLVERGHLQLSLIHFWPGDATSIRTTAPLPADRWVHVAIRHDGSARAGGLALFIDGERAATAVVRDALTRSITGGGGLVLTLGERFRDRGFKGGAVDEVRVFDRWLTDPEIAQVAGRSDEVVPTLRYYLETVDPQWREQRSALRRHRQRLAALIDDTPQIMVMAETAAPRATFVRRRGAYDAAGERVDPGTPACLPAWPAELPPNRLGLARWLTAPDHPLTARVAVNRLWQMLFGRGLVPTPEDFGSQGVPPTHPLLLDWLASEFVASGWDVKRMLTLMVSSATYRQSSRSSSDVDPDNVWLGRAPRYRLSAEQLRDQALAVSGLLVRTIGGEPAKPYQPPGLWKEKSGASYRPDQGEGLYRRSLYTVWKRTSPPPSMMILDAAKRDVCVARRQVTDTPLQALLLLNDPQFVEAARVLAERMLQFDAGDRLATLFRTLAGRQPDGAELDVLRSALGDARAHFAADPAAAKELLGVGYTRPAPDLDAVDVAALATVAGTLMSHDAVVMRR